MRVLSFETLFQRQDVNYDRSDVPTYACGLRSRYHSSEAESVIRPVEPNTVPSEAGQVDRVDAFRTLQQRAIVTLGENPEFISSIERGGIPWGRVSGLLRDALPSTMDDRDRAAYSLVPRAMTELLGAEGVAWGTERRGPKQTLFIVKKNN